MAVLGSSERNRKATGAPVWGLVLGLCAAGLGCSGGGERPEGWSVDSAPLDTVGGTEPGGTTGSDGETSFEPGTSTSPPNDTNCDGGQTGGEDEGSYDFSVIWIANSEEGTVSKIDTVTGVELARYRTGPDEPNGPDPSRTSVNLHGDAAVLNRRGSVIKIVTRIEECPDADGDGVINTSTGPGDVKAWGDDECVAWSQPLPFAENTVTPTNPNTYGPRPIAWEANTSTETCMAPPTRLWVAWYEGPTTHRAAFRRLEGADGSIDAEVYIGNMGDEYWGPYGGAIDPDNDFWAVIAERNLARIDGVSLETKVWEMPQAFYGIAIDEQGRPWITGGGDNSIVMFDPVTEVFTSIGVAEVPGLVTGSLRGLAIDSAGFGWAAGNLPCRLVKFDLGAAAYVDTNIPLPGCENPVGVAIDASGFVWVVDQAVDQAYKLDPATHAVELTVTGLVSPYTYSDMTGWGLNLVSVPEG